MIPAAVAAWYAAFVIGASTYSFIESRLCPTDELISGFCTNRSIRVALDVTMHLFVASSAIAVVMASVSVAPNRKKQVAWVAFALGAAIALYFAARTHSYPLLASALGGGLVTVAGLHWLHARRE